MSPLNFTQFHSIALNPTYFIVFLRSLQITSKSLPQTFSNYIKIMLSNQFKPLQNNFIYFIRYFGAILKSLQTTSKAILANLFNHFKTLLTNLSNQLNYVHTGNFKPPPWNTCSEPFNFLNSRYSLNQTICFSECCMILYCCCSVNSSERTRRRRNPFGYMLYKYTVDLWYCACCTFVLPLRQMKFEMM